MFLKKINPQLELALAENGFTEPLELQKETFSPIKSGVDLVIQSPEKSGKSTAIALNVIHRLDKPFEQSPRALIIVQNKEKVLEMASIFETLNYHNKLRVFHTYEQTDIDNDKNLISVGIDVLIGTPRKLNELFSGAGFDINRLKFFIVDDLDIIIKNRQEPIITRLSNANEKVQKVFFTSVITEKIEMLADSLMIEPTFLETDNEEEDF